MNNIKTFKKRVFAYILCTALFAAVLLTLVFNGSDSYAAKKVFSKDGLTYKITSASDESKTVAITGCDISGEIIIPETVVYKENTYNVTAIQNAAFAFKDVSFVVIPDGVVSIGASAFANCSSLEAINLPASIESIGTGAFSYCPLLEKIDIDEDNNDYCFKNGILYTADRSVLLFATDACAKEIKTGSKVTEIAPYAFEGNRTVESFTTSSSLKKISDKAFIDSSLKKAVIKKYVTEIEGNPFIYCTKLESISVAKKNKNYTTTAEGLLLTKDKKTLISAGAVKGKLVIPSSVKTVGAFAAAGNSNITSLVFDKKNENVEEYAFCDCTSLEKVYVASRSLVLPKKGNVFTNTPFFMEINVPYSSKANDKDSLESMLRENSPKGVIITSR